MTSSADDNSFNVPDLTPNDVCRTEIIIKRSRFITSLGVVHTPEEAHDFIQKISQEFKDASHNCYAFNAGEAGSTRAIGCSDAGEPKGTAGQPMLNVLVHSGVGMSAVVVTRYFGGTLLGTGGLVKAYQDSIKKILEELPVKKYIPEITLTVLVSPSYADEIVHAVNEIRGSVISREFGCKVTFKIVIPLASLSSFKENCGNITRGSVLIQE